MGFFQCKADPEVWMRDKGDHYEYVSVFVDDLEVASKDPESIMKMLTDDYKFKLKGTGPLEFYLGCGFHHDSHGTLCQNPRKYIEKMLTNFEKTFGYKAREYTSPLEKGDHPEIDTSELLDAEGIKDFQSLIGQCQWAVSIGRFDIMTAVMTLSSFRAAPRRGHLERACRIVGYLSKMKHGMIRYRVDLPDYSDLPDTIGKWDLTAYHGATELLPHDMPEPKGKSVNTTSYVDANLYHNLLDGCSVTGILHFINQTPIDWYSKKQGTVETSTYGSEFVAARTGTEQKMDIRTTLRYFGVPVGKSVMFGDNKSVLDSSTIPHSKLTKRHTALSYHRVREAVAAKVLSFFHIPGKDNPADVLSKHWGYQQVWPLLQPLLFWEGDTMGILDSQVLGTKGGIKC